MIVEDHLKKLLTSNTNHPFKTSNNKLLPRAQHSPFGDFPADKMPTRKTKPVTEPPAIEKHELSVSAKGISKYKISQNGLKPENSKKPLSFSESTEISKFSYLTKFYLCIATLKKGEGLGGKAVSLNKPKERPAPQKPVAGAFNRRNIPSSEFRRFYDRGDLPIAIEHGP
jgi:hypothetical protein